MNKFFESILIPVDLSVNTELAVKKALTLSESGTVIHLLYVQTYFMPFVSASVKDYFVNAKALARGIYDILKAMEDEGNSNDYRSTTYLYHELERRVIELNQTYKLIKHYISGFKQPQAQP
jgi:nucleotide-binding universal stress UspA family protein